jgi:hypothetical protein
LPLRDVQHAPFSAQRMGGENCYTTCRCIKNPLIRYRINKAVEFVIRYGVGLSCSGNCGTQFYVRVGNSTRAFGVQEALDFARDRWGGLVLQKPRAGHAAAT